ncbi:MAG TPA: HD domain-containing phosphohydrolase [Candidatus Latescibacteria bacterium]|jgi:HD-GYP domain-containing protein (c-di-GMP phosphodiesterase class II)|nr:HD domain-containing phosphohydrolase [Candidatus Latescibacterota bacterium]HJP32546.1 HD domain-containing phosphohydrolase [Candidatus Latescibacterota bacterium]
MATERLDQDLEDRLRRLNEIGAALSLERDLHTLLDRILLEARRFTGADAGALFLVSGNSLTFEVAQNDTLKLAHETDEGIVMPPVPLDESSASGFCAVRGETLNIEDVYAEDAPRRFEGPRQYDGMTGYHTRSMLMVPMRDHEDQITGVLQLLNAKDPATGEVRAFPSGDEPLVLSLASQAAVSVNNVRLIDDTERLFQSFVQVMATAIDERSPYTGGHIRRVAEMTMHVAQRINACTEGPLAAATLDEDQMDELRLAAWMHDIGKITTPEWVVDKPTKLTTIYDRIDMLCTRYAWISAELEARYQRERADQLEAGSKIDATRAEAHERIRAELDDDLAFLQKANLPGEFMEEADLERLRSVAGKSYGEGLPTPLSAEEVENLAIRKGSLTETERQKINDHAAMSIRMLETIPFTRTLAKVPAIAGAHHEKLDGSGYPRGLQGEEISLQARILALVDIFESLSADDRPYRSQPIPRDVVLRILREEVDAGHLDRDVFDLFIGQQLYLKLDDIKAADRALVSDS